MSDERDMSSDAPELALDLAPDPVLRAALADALGGQPAVDWAAMSQRARSAALFRLRARARVAPWWEQVTPWAMRLLPVGALAAAAALALAMATPRETPAADATVATINSDSRDAVADAIVAPNGTGTVSRVAGPVDDDWFWNATAAAHAAEAR